jgi:hypothetical protein
MGSFHCLRPYSCDWVEKQIFKGLPHRLGDSVNRALTLLRYSAVMDLRRSRFSAAVSGL